MISPKQMKILAFSYSSYDAIICNGAIRSGKTSILTVAFIDWAMREFSGQRFGICGNTVGSATQNIIMPYTLMAYARQRYVIKWRKSDKILEISRGPVKNYFEVFGGKDESSYKLIQGRTLAGVLLDEVVLMPRSFVEQAMARCSVHGAKLWFSCNPDSPKHWFYTEWIRRYKERNALLLNFTLEDNPGLSEDTRRKYKSMYSGVFFERYILGHWVLAEGLVYPMFNAEEHTVKDASGPGLYYVSIDYGTVNPMAMELWRIDEDAGTAVLVRMYYFNSRTAGKQKTDEEYYEDLENFVGDIDLERVIVDPSAASFIECIRRHGKFYVLKAKNDVLDGIRFTAAMIQQGRVKIHESCEAILDEFGLYRWDDEASEDRVIKENDHAMDAMRYLLYTLRKKYFYDRGE